MQTIKGNGQSKYCICLHLRYVFLSCQGIWKRTRFLLIFNFFVFYRRYHMGSCWYHPVIFLFVTVKWYQMNHLTVLASNITLLPGSFSFVIYFSLPFTMRTQEGCIHRIIKALWKTSSTKLCKYESTDSSFNTQLLVTCLCSEFHKLITTEDCNVWAHNGLRT
jgi:hypothetical protein